MKGKLKCFGLCLALLTMLGLSLNASSDVSAYKFQLNYMPLYTYSYVEHGTSFNSFDSGPGFSISWPSASAPSLDNYRTVAPLWWSPYYDSTNNKCYWNSVSNSNLPYSSGGHWSFSNGTYRPYTNTYARSVYEFSDSTTPTSGTICRSLYPFGSNGVPSLDSDSFPSGAISLLFKPLRPYAADYSSYTYYDTWTSDTGVVYGSHGLKLDDILSSYNVSRMGIGPSSMTIPIGMVRDIASDNSLFSIQQGTTIRFNYGLHFTQLTQYDLTYLENASVKLGYKYVKSNGTSVSQQFISCSTSVEDYDNFGIHFDWYCDFTVSEDVYDDNLISFWFIITPGSGYSSIWNVTFDTSGSIPEQDFKYSDGRNANVSYISFYSDSISIITDNDYTSGGYIGGSSLGSNPGSSPGSAEFEHSISRPDESSPDWLSTLTNLFHFSFTNPLSPLFAAFTSGDDCVNIPTIAGMLNSEETTYCPWFSANTRGILTPVLSIVSIMLLFGFIVRWLGSSSGNFFEDSQGEELSNVNHSGFRRYKK